MKNKLIFLLAMALMVAMVFTTACGGNSKPAEEKKEETKEEEVAEEPAEEAKEAEETAEEEEDEENYETGDASLDKVRNEDEIGEVELLVTSFGTSFNDSRRLTIGAIEQAVEDAFPDYSIRRAFTSQIIIDHVLKRDNVKIDNFGEALDRAEANGVKTLVVIPTHLMSGFEYNDVVNEMATRAEAFEKVVIGKPLLDTDEDFKRVAEALHEDTASYDDGETAIVFMGHGTEAESNAVYAKMQETMTGLGYENYYIGTVEAEPTLDDVIAALKEKEYKKVVLQPMMVVAGDHANNDMAGDEEDSWKTILTNEGYEVTAVLKGVGEIEAIRNIYVEHAQAAVAEAAGEAAEEEEAEENYETGDASLDKVRNEDEIGEVELLVTSFGTSFNDSRRLTIGAIEQAVEDAFPDYSVRRAFTSQIIIDHVLKRDNVKIDNFGEALDRAEANGVKTLVVIPTHLMSGFEYNDVVNEMATRAEAFEKVVIGKPLLDTDEDFKRVAEALHEDTASYDDGETAIVFMGHGTEAESNAVYAKMQETMTGLGYENYYIGTVEAEPTLDDVIAALKAKEYKKVVLQPMMVVAGDHANNDMAGDEEDSWKTILTNEGYEVTAVLKGVGEIEAIRNIYVEHAQAAVAGL